MVKTLHVVQLSHKDSDAILPNSNQEYITQTQKLNFNDFHLTRTQKIKTIFSAKLGCIFKISGFALWLN